MAAKPVLSFEEVAEALRNAPPATADDVSILPDGRRVDSRESALAWLAELAAARQAAVRQAAGVPVEE
ncbi:MAG: hypothetical protein ACRDYC_01670 [Acidimicrobiales bacterium]